MTSFLGHFLPDKVKQRIKRVTDFVGKARNIDELENDLVQAEDEIFTTLLYHAQLVVGMIQSEPHRRNLLAPITLALWTACFDTAYRHPALAVLKAITQDADLMEAIRTADVPPAPLWFVNATEDERVRDSLDAAEEDLA